MFQLFVNNQTGEETIFEADEADGSFGMFVFAGNKPNTAMFKDKVAMTPQGFIPTNEAMATDVPGVYAIGDLRVKELRQIVTAVADGAIAATNAQQYVNQEKERLGIPVTHKEVRTTSAQAVEKPAAATKIAKAAKAGEWFPAAMREQLQGIFSKLTKEVRIKTILDPSNKKTSELASFVTEISELNDKISVETIQLGADPEFETAINLERLPVAVLFNSEDDYTGIKFSGIPSGHELNSLVLGIYNVGSEGQALEANQLEKIQTLPKTKIQIFVSLTCHFCPDVVAACQRIAAANHNVEAEMIDTGLFPELKKEKKIMSVPAMIINDEKVVFGAKSLDEILGELS